MRLTLRTLLAYLDGNLDADDSQDIGKKIEESEFATKLVHLIRDCTRRLRLGAPPVIGRGLGADPNSVAEYLEYRLADDRVPEFERICLESEVQLAEVAACHQILTLVLGEPAEIDAATRERLYRVPTQADQPADSAPAAAAPPAPPMSRPATPPPVVRRPKPEVPEYLRESRWRFWPVAALVLVAAMLTFAGLLAFDPAGLREQATAVVQAPTDEAPTLDPAAPPENAPAQDDPGKEPAEPPATEDPIPPTPADTPATEPDDRAIVAPDKPADDDPDAPPAPEPAPLEPAPSDPTPPEPDAEAASPAAPEAPSGDAKPAEMPDKPKAAAEEPVPGAAPPATDAPEAAPREPAEGFGRYTSKQAVLLKLDPDSGNWGRLRPLAPLDKGDHLLSLPLFRPAITLSSNITIQADGAAQFELEGWDADGVPILSIHYGRLLMLTIGKAANPLILKVDGQESLVTFVDAESSLAIEVRRDLTAGQDPEAGPSPLVASVFATDGTIRLRRDDAPIEFQAPSARALVTSAVQPATDAAFPDWVSRDLRTATDDRATSDVEGYLTTDKLAGLQLRELTDVQHKLGRRREVRSLATRSLAHMGDFEPSLAALNDEDLHNFWPAVTGELRSALARSPSTAAAVRVMLEKQRGAADGAALYRMLWGYSAAQLSAGADRDLVQALDRNDALDFRVLAILNLEGITGGTHGYHPEDSEIRRRVPYNTWRQKIGKIAPRASGSSTKARAKGS